MTTAAKYALFLAMPMGAEDMSVAQVLQAYKEVLAPYVQAYTISPDKLHLTPPCVASGGLPTLYDTTSGQRTGNGRTAATLAAMGSRLLAGALPPAGAPATLRPPRPEPAMQPSVPYSRPQAGLPAGAVAGPAEAVYQGVPASYQSAVAEAAPAGGGAQPLSLSSGSGRVGSGGRSGYARSGGHGMAWSEFSPAAAMEDGLFAAQATGFNEALMPMGPLLASPAGPGDGGFRPPTEFGAAPPLVPESSDRREKRVGEAEAEALAALRSSRDRVLRSAYEAGSASSGAAGTAAGTAASSTAASAAAAAAAQELTRSQERARDSGLMLTRPLGITSAPGAMRPPSGMF